MTACSARFFCDDAISLEPIQPTVVITWYVLYLTFHSPLMGVQEDWVPQARVGPLLRKNNARLKPPDKGGSLAVRYQSVRMHKILHVEAVTSRLDVQPQSFHNGM